MLVWQAQMARDTAAIERALNTRLAESVALTYMQLMNPVGPSSGEQDIGGGWQLQWTAEPLTPVKTLRYGLTDNGRHQGALYLVRGQLRSAAGPGASFETTVAGIEETRPFEPL